MTTKQADWEAIERAYRAGALSIRTTAAGSAYLVQTLRVNRIRPERKHWTACDGR
ncbi:hypothetical protein H4B97_25530 [Pseudomonas juntendi]|uniref:Uncharacterized protein n=1 Tax=Pseudomonas juntendi TaxID=2666183 RepID=A0A7W2KD80_9PSED|nr:MULTISPECIES: hypothetical protein [Pseudomonas]MBA6096348.1 hypothetical protein [Pseudomonas juntendi]MBA6145792.1 hypothetical protein [Pseudomonas juntendi]SUD78196.1 putative phage-like protein [Pseudomonas putida]